MYIAGRLALQSPLAAANFGGASDSAPKADIMTFHGCDIVVRQICERGFEADVTTPLVTGALVRLRLPGAGTMLARVTHSASGRLSADFINPVSEQRLRQVLGVTHYSKRVA